MNTKSISKTQKIAISGMVMALYIVVLYATQSFSFGAYQIRIATSLYSLSYFFPFLVVPMGLANFISNMMFGGMGLVDMIGGCVVGIFTTSCIVCIRKMNLSHWFVILPIILVPGLGVASWLSYLLNMPYPALAVSLCIGQTIPAICEIGRAHV